jgi:hypothetical protein
MVIDRDMRITPSETGALQPETGVLPNGCRLPSMTCCLVESKAAHSDISLNAQLARPVRRLDWPSG